MVYRELRETCSKLGEEMFSKSAEAGSKGTNYFSIKQSPQFLHLPKLLNIPFFNVALINIYNFVVHK